MVPFSPLVPLFYLLELLYGLQEIHAFVFSVLYHPELILSFTQDKIQYLTVQSLEISDQKVLDISDQEILTF